MRMKLVLAATAMACVGVGVGVASAQEKPPAAQQAPAAKPETKEMSGMSILGNQDQKDKARYSIRVM